MNHWTHPILHQQDYLHQQDRRYATWNYHWVGFGQIRLNWLPGSLNPYFDSFVSSKLGIAVGQAALAVPVAAVTANHYFRWIGLRWIGYCCDTDQSFLGEQSLAFVEFRARIDLGPVSTSSSSIDQAAD